MNTSRSLSAYALSLLSAYAVSMALLEAAVVVYMRRLYYPANPLELFPLDFLGGYDPTLELSREVSTIIMIVTVALLTERRSLTRSFAAFVFVFGLWDLFYYVWLKLLMDWPQSWLEWDVLFLIPMIWLGPWICPVLIASLFIVWGWWILRSKEDIHLTGIGLAIFVIAAVTGLVSFMQPALAEQVAGRELSEYLPGRFWWWLYIPSLIGMAYGLSFTRVDAGPLLESS